MNLEITLYTDRGAALTPRLAKMLGGIEEYGSILKVHEKMGWAYSSMWDTIHKFEAVDDTKLVESHRGLSGSVLTDTAHEYLNVYERAQDAAKEVAQ